ncbi:hypothetical protein GR160_07950 [Flavobacterium sp. Sd200]|uniref:hypothetical protein n=1 Tax=Flavobacterium sp. Sd200 TaxID=2692211 RepID=UPI001367DEC2|nr:hypothetical protein [Flavobacterium sp. Sd200]MXN91162.1 hypothetical protein [Flavobacterium sp. Sd200]
MENQSLIQTLKAIWATICIFCSQHTQSTAAMKKAYLKQWPGDTASDGHTLVAISVIPYGSIFKVHQLYYLQGELQRQKTWLATYGWHSNGHLIEIGGDRHCIFNPAGKELYFEYFDANVDKVTETYKEL